MVSRLRLCVRIFNSIQKSSSFLLRNLGSIKNPGESGESFSRLRPGESGFRQKSSAFLLREKTEYTHRLDLLTKSDSSKTTSPTHFLILPRGGLFPPHRRGPYRGPPVEKIVQDQSIPERRVKLRFVGKRKSQKFAREKSRGNRIPGNPEAEFPPGEDLHGSNRIQNPNCSDCRPATLGQRPAVFTVVVPLKVRLEDELSFIHRRALRP